MEKTTDAQRAKLLYILITKKIEKRPYQGIIDINLEKSDWETIVAALEIAYGL
jgi:hypothetical protein